MNAPRPSDEVDLACVATFHLGRLEVRPASREVQCAVARTVAEPRALQVLVALHQAGGAVLSRDALVRRCWGGRAVGEDAIQRAIAKARRLADLCDPPAFAIESIARVGYRLAIAAPSLSEPAVPRPRSRWRGVLIAGVAAVATAGLAVGFRLHSAGDAAPASRPAATSPAMPPDRTASALLLQARDDWAQRTRESLGRSIGEFSRVTRLAPDFAPAFADLADAYLLAGEAGSLPEDVAFDGAQHAASRALALDPRLAGAHRAIGFIQYWQRHDATDAGRAFRTAIGLDAGSAQTHFWYANALADDGEDAAAQREFDRARLEDPGSDQIGADYAWARWMAGADREAAERLAAIVARNPANAEAQDCLASVALSAGDYAGFLRAREVLAQLRGEPELSARTAALAQAFKAGGARALLSLALAQELALQEAAAYPNHSEAAFIASLMGDRAALARVLARADAEHEAWGSAGYVRRIRARWAGDGPILAALARRSSPPLEPT